MQIQRIVVLAVLSASALAGTSHAAVSLSLVPEAPGPYSPGEAINIDVFLVNEGEGSMDVRLLQVDFALTDPALEVGAFEFDFSSLLTDIRYGDFSSGTVVNRTLTGGCPVYGCVLQYDEGPNRMASLAVTLPTARGEYVLDLLNPLAPDNNTGANFQWNWGPTQQAWSGDGTLTGGRMTLTVIPEPATLLLLAIGAGVVCRTRERRRVLAIGEGWA